MTNNFFRPIRSLRENLSIIGAAVNASHEYSRASVEYSRMCIARAGAETTDPATAAIPL